MNFLSKLLHRDTLESVDVSPEADRVDALERDLTLLEKQLEVFKLDREEYERASSN